MKIFVAFVLLTATVMAEPPRYRPQQQRQFYFARQQEETTTVASAPYAPSGWRSPGPAFNLPPREPQRQYGAPSAPQQQYGAPAAPQQQYGAPAAPQQQYGAPSAPQQQYGAPAAPQQQYGAPSVPQSQYGPPAVPQQQYGPPQETTTTEVPDTTEVDTVASVTESESEPVNSVNELDDEEVDEQQPQQSGEYYVALPDGRLQRVRYVSRQNIEAMKYFAKIRAENVEPLRGPIYAYAPLQKLQIVPAGLQVSVAPVTPIATPAESKPQKLEIQPVATQVQYQYDNPAGVLPLGSGSYAAYTGPSDSRYFLTLP
ncbi:RNA polymerase II degradation factor 1 [Bombus impatiens]|uniref:RNA polymerase II degradation factor 1 n=1 Tax=Bombus impatiens TaxID=132113 RepID=A0A6P3UMF9_BOMIM|nr:RNA polymerase II degradation factor 1 [Bombus impatiens]